MSKNLIIVESPAKSKTISKILGKTFDISASYGHVRDLPAKRLGVNIKNNFEPVYSNIKDKKKVIKELQTKAKNCKNIYIATDPDREGEAIAWHILAALKVKDKEIKRIVFNEITENAIKNALEHWRDIDINLVNAQQARRILDRLIGYKLSPVLSKKIKKGLSAGRVQSIAVKIVCDREELIQKFVPEEYWEISTLFKNDNYEITSHLFAKDTIKDKIKINNESETKQVISDLTDAKFEVNSIKKTTVKRNPPPPFITSTLQQDAARKLGWTVKKTMIVAQQLYEGVDINNETVGLITYMRTDSIRIADEAKQETAQYIEKQYGKDYLSSFTAKKSKSNAKIQDAHEAIRPSYVTKDPKSIQTFISADQFKLYKLIWQRLVASQMSQCISKRTQITVKSSKDQVPSYFFKTIGSIIEFEGFTKVYTEYLDPSKQEEESKKALPKMIKEKDPLSQKSIDPEQKFTQPPARFNEASLVKELEEQGIGRPSTYAPTISVIQDRGYIEKENKSFIPTELGTLVNKQLEEFFTSITDIKFTAKMERELDEITEGKHEWQSVVSNFYTPLSKLIDNAYEKMERIKLDERFLGYDPENKEEVYAKIGRYGPLIQWGNKEDEKPKFASLLPSQNIQEITLKEALELFNLPLTIGDYNNQEVTINNGRYGPYIKVNSMFISIPKNLNPLTLNLDDAMILIKEHEEKEKNKYLHRFTTEDPAIEVVNGRYGPYIKHGKNNIKIPKSYDPKELTLKDCLTIIENAPKKKKK
ncbi:type I DNA topoisomerase [Candidatus Marinamargulisbacteria bacterium SCGC AG-410-N11]|nr:type I DNA topoisomerase [Candidatus Marinamargulisbacteria bacterium SCGC AG-410-N11]